MTSGSPYQFPRSSTRNSSRPRNASAMTTPNGALGARNQITGSCAGSSSAATVALSVSCHKMRGRNGAFHYYYYCRNHDPLRAGGEHRQCPERNVRAGELDAFVFDQVRATMLRPDVLLAGEAAVSTRRKAGSDELLATQLAGLDRKIDAIAAERRRLADLYQASFIEREELLRRGKELELRSSALNAQRQALIDQREELAQQNRLRDRVEGFARRVQPTIDRLDFAQRQKLLRLVIDEVRVSGWLVEIRFRIPLDNPPEPPNTRVSTKNRLRSLHRHDDGVMEQSVQQRGGDDGIAEHFGMPQRFVARTLRRRWLASR